MAPGARAATDEYNLDTHLCAESGGHKSVNPMEGFWSVLRSWLRPHRGLSQERLSLCLGFVEFIHKVGKWGKALLGVLIERLVSSDPGIQYERFFYLDVHFTSSLPVLDRLKSQNTLIFQIS
jgi:hypothetical protein